MRYFIIFLVLCYVDYSRACNGYSLTVKSVKNCVDNPVIKLPEKGFDVKLDKDCNLYTTGCGEITKSFKTAEVTYHIKKPPLPLIEGDFDLCKASDQLKNFPEIANGIAAIGIPTYCPVQAEKICNGADKSISLARFKSQIGMAAGNTDLKLEIQHDVGKSCFQINIALNKPRRG